MPLVWQDTTNLFAYRDYFIVIYKYIFLGTMDSVLVEIFDDNGQGFVAYIYIDVPDYCEITHVVAMYDIRNLRMLSPGRVYTHHPR